jgi:hypothetical protein
VLGDAFARGEAAPFDVLLPRLVDPPFETLGYFSVDEVLPREERTALALALNNVAASPAFRRGSPASRSTSGRGCSPARPARPPSACCRWRTSTTGSGRSS